MTPRLLTVYGCLFSLDGIDEEGLTDQELDAAVRSVEGALRGLPEGACLYQYTRVLSGFALPQSSRYASPVIQSNLLDLRQTCCSAKKVCDRTD